jgi:hypothetical protein
MKKRISKKVATIIIAISIIPAFFLLILMAILIYGYLFNHPTSDSDIKKVALDYAKARCYADEKDNKFCDNLYVSSIFKEEDFAAVWWIVYVQRPGSEDVYSSFDIVGDGDRLKVKEDTYTLNQSQ